MNGYNIPYEANSNETPSGELLTSPILENPIPVEPNGGPGGDVGPLYGKSVVTPVGGSLILVPSR